MQMSEHDRLLMECLSLFVEGYDPPDGCDVELLETQGLAQHTSGFWKLTDRGKVLLKKFESAARNELVSNPHPSPPNGRNGAASDYSGNWRHEKNQHAEKRERRQSDRGGQGA